MEVRRLIPSDVDMQECDVNLCWFRSILAYKSFGMLILNLHIFYGFMGALGLCPWCTGGRVRVVGHAGRLGRFVGQMSHKSKSEHFKVILWKSFLQTWSAATRGNSLQLVANSSKWQNT